jgi:hypothetical protein
MHAYLVLVQAIQQWPIGPLPGVRAGDAAAGTSADGHYARRYANLLADGEADTQGSGPAADLARCLTEHFAAPATPRYGHADLDPRRPTASCGTRSWRRCAGTGTTCWGA